MVSERKIEANRRNAAHSTGPRTPEGKAVVARNALAHGLTATANVLLDGEDPAEWQTFQEAFRLALRPASPLEEWLLARFIAAAWRLQRLQRVETSLYAHAIDHARTVVPPTPTTIDEAGQAAEPPPPAARLADGWLALAAEPDAWSILSRYETTLEHIAYRALTQLANLRSKERRAQPSTLLAAVDGSSAASPFNQAITNLLRNYSSL